jgi:hypothetical protein
MAHSQGPRAATRPYPDQLREANMAPWPRQSKNYQINDEKSKEEHSLWLMVTRRDPAASKLPWKGPRPRCPKKRFSSNQPKLRMPLWRTSWSHRYFLDGEAEGSKNSSRALLLAQQIERQRHGQGFSGEGERRAQGSTVGCFCDFKTATGLFAPLFRVQSIHRNLLTNAGLRVNNCDKVMCVGAHGILILPRAAGLSSLKLLPLNSFCPPPVSVWLCL